jgi:tetratricopeptide (TPR) repeat protein
MDANRQLNDTGHAMTAAAGPSGLLVDAMQIARSALNEDLLRHPTYPDLHHRLALLLLALGECGMARIEFEEALGIHPGYRAAYYGLRLALLRLGELSPSSEPSPEDSPPAAEEAIWRALDHAYRLEALGEDPQAALADLPTVCAHHYRAAFAARRGDAGPTQRHLEAAAAASATSASILQAWGLSPCVDDAPEPALQALQGILWTPLAADLYSYVARIFARNGQQDRALHTLGRAYLVSPHEAQYACHRAEIAIAFGAEDEALDLLRAAVEADPGFARARVALGFECAAQGMTEEARRQLEIASTLAPGYADVRYNLGLLYAGAGRPAEALDQFRSALSLNPAYLPARHSMASLLCRLDRNDEGLREYARILRQGFQSADMLVRMGRAALALGRPDEALQYLERAGFVNPDYPLGYFYLGQAYKEKGLKRKAHSAWRRYLDAANDWNALTPDPVQSGDPQSDDSEE